MVVNANHVQDELCEKPQWIKVVKLYGFHGSPLHVLEPKRKGLRGDFVYFVSKFTMLLSMC